MLFDILLYLGILFCVASEIIRPLEVVPLNGDPDHLEQLNADGRIDGVQEADILAYPYQVSFVVNNSYFCGGSIISKDYILTAAHCAQNVDPSTVVLRAGSTFRKNGTIIPIAEVVPYTGYNAPAYDNDVAIMKTVSPINFTDSIKPIALPPIDRQVFGRTNITVSGWGRTEDGAPTIPHLRAVELPVVPFLLCYFAYPGTITENMICAGDFILGGKGGCQGDSGSPAVQDGLVVGVVSFGRGCGDPLSPTVFANIAAPLIRDFITNTTGI